MHIVVATFRLEQQEDAGFSFGAGSDYNFGEINHFASLGEREKKITEIRGKCTNFAVAFRLRSRKDLRSLFAQVFKEGGWSADQAGSRTIFKGRIVVCSSLSASCLLRLTRGC